MSRLLDSGGSIPLEPLPIETVVRGTPVAGARALVEVADVEIGVWEMTAGVASDVEVDEVFVVVSGSATVAFHDGEVIDLSPGSVVQLRAGDQTIWTVRETLRKVYIAQ